MQSPITDPHQSPVDASVLCFHVLSVFSCKAFPLNKTPVISIILSSGHFIGINNPVAGIVLNSLECKWKTAAHMYSL